MSDQPVAKRLRKSTQGYSRHRMLPATPPPAPSQLPATPVKAPAAKAIVIPSDRSHGQGLQDKLSPIASTPSINTNGRNLQPPKSPDVQAQASPQHVGEGMLQMGQTVITLRVGLKPKHTDFTVHESLLRRTSPFFRAALGQNWLESQEKLIKLPGYQPHQARVYIQWLYTGRLHTGISVEKDSHRSVQFQWACLVSAYFFGNYIRDADFKDSVMDGIVQWVNKNAVKWTYTMPNVATEIYENTEDGSPLRDMFIDFTSWRLLNECSKILNDQGFPRGFLSSVMARMTRRRLQEPALSSFLHIKEPCRYHSHGSSACYKIGAATSAYKLSNDELAHFRRLI